jgi:hypothetical protein
VIGIMSDAAPLSLTLQIELDSPADPEAVEALTRQLRQELQDADIENFTYPKSSSPEGAKALELEAAVTGALIGAVAQVTLPYLVQVIQSWLKRHRQNKISLDCGSAQIQISGDELPDDVVARLRRACLEDAPPASG